MVNLFIDGVLTQYKKWNFPGGEVGVQLNESTVSILENYNSKMQVEVVVEGLHTSEDIFVVGNLLNAIKSVLHNIKCTLTFKYLPYARQDRKCNEGESFALSVFMKVVTNFEFDTLKVYDPHSDVYLRHLDKKVIVVRQDELTKNLPKYDWIVAPDKGASEKAKLTQPDVNHIFLNKVRQDGKVIYEDLKRNSICGKVCVVDDIGDGMGTFISLAEMLHRTQPHIERLDVFVTHGIFSKGLEIMKGLYNNVYTFNLLQPELRGHPLLVEITQ